MSQTAGEFEVGKTYRIDHIRKGRFVVKVTAINGEWVSSILADGKTKMLLAANDIEVGEALTFRASFATIIDEIKEEQIDG